MLVKPFDHDFNTGGYVHCSCGMAVSAVKTYLQLLEIHVGRVLVRCESKIVSLPNRVFQCQYVLQQSKAAL